jgi:hypothetical protein
MGVMSDLHPPSAHLLRFDAKSHVLVLKTTLLSHSQ